MLALAAYPIAPFQGYYSHNGLCLELDQDGWFHTRDRGRPIGARREILGRLFNQFISGGENIPLEEIEHQLLALPEITQAVVVPDPGIWSSPSCYCPTHSCDFRPRDPPPLISRVHPAHQ